MYFWNFFKENLLRRKIKTIKKKKKKKQFVQLWGKHWQSIRNKQVTYYLFVGVCDLKSLGYMQLIY